VLHFRIEFTLILDSVAQDSAIKGVADLFVLGELDKRAT
jgi:hypothetical protein